MTRWMNLGCGLTKEDPLWKVRVGLFDEHQEALDSLQKAFDSLEKIDKRPRESFEDTAMLPLKGLRPYLAGLF